MTDPKRAEPANEHAENLRTLDPTKRELLAAAAEIERLEAENAALRHAIERYITIASDWVPHWAQDPESKPDQETKGER